MTSSKFLLILVMTSSGILMINGVSISAVTVTNTESMPAPQSVVKSLSMINIPQVPDFPKLAARPSKSPLSGGSIPFTPNFNQQPPTQQQQLHNQQQPQQASLIPAFGLPVAFASVPASQQDPEKPLLETLEDLLEDDLKEEQDKSSDANFGSVTENVDNNVYHPEEPPVTTSVSKNEPFSNKHASAALPDKIQENPNDFSIPLHVMNILTALGSGGSVAQASKPEKDGVGHGQGYTTANAIGYATGDNANVNASVSNKMELNSHTVILTESASASASSMSNGTAFSHATLSSNGYINQLGPGGSGWKSNNKNPVAMIV